MARSTDRLAVRGGICYYIQTVTRHRRPTADVGTPARALDSWPGALAPGTLADPTAPISSAGATGGRRTLAAG